MSMLASVELAMIRAIATTSRSRVRTLPVSIMCADSGSNCEPASRSDAMLRNKLIPCSIDRQQVLRVGRVRLQLLPQLENLIIHRAGGWVGIISPHFVEQQFAAQNLFGMVGEELQQLELMRGKSDGRASALRSHFLKIDLAIVEAVGHRIRGPAA